MHGQKGLIMETPEQNEINTKVTINTHEVINVVVFFLVNFEQISHLILVFPLLI